MILKGQANAHPSSIFAFGATASDRVTQAFMLKVLDSDYATFDAATGADYHHLSPYWSSMGVVDVRHLEAASAHAVIATRCCS